MDEEIRTGNSLKARRSGEETRRVGQGGGEVKIPGKTYKKPWKITIFNG